MLTVVHSLRRSWCRTIQRVLLLQLALAGVAMADIDALERSSTRMELSADGVAHVLSASAARWADDPREHSERDERSGHEGQDRLLDLDQDSEREDKLSRLRLQEPRSAWWSPTHGPSPRADSSPSLREDRRSSRPPNV